MGSFTRTFRGMEPLGIDPGCADVIVTRSAGSDGVTATAADDNVQQSKIDLRDQLEFLLQRNRACNQSLENIESFWSPKLSTLNPKVIIDAENDADNDEGN